MAGSFKASFTILDRVPTALFPIALGLSGLGSVFLAAGQSLGLPYFQELGIAFLITAAVTLVIDITLYFAKIMRARIEVANDFRTAIRANLIAPAFMAAMVLGGQLATITPIGELIWIAAVFGHLYLLTRFAGRWLTRNYDPVDLNPTWFLPAAGLMTAPMTWPGIGPVAFAWFALAVGASLWLMLLPPIFRRLVFEPALFPPLRPTLFILAAPFGLMANAILTIYGTGMSDLAILFAFAGTFLIILLLSQPRHLIESGVSLSWWAATFPITAVSLAFFRLEVDAAFQGSLFLGMLLLILATLATSLAMIATIRLAWKTCLGTIENAEQEIAAMQGDEIACKNRNSKILNIMNSDMSS